MVSQIFWWTAKGQWTQKLVWFPTFKKMPLSLPWGPNFPLFLKPLRSGILAKDFSGFSVATLEVLAISWLPTKTITRDWKLSHRAHSGSQHLKGKVSNFLRIKKISFHNFQNILITSEIWKRFSLGRKPALFNVFLRYTYFLKKNIEILLLNLWEQDLNCFKVAMYQPLNKNAAKKFMFTDWWINITSIRNKYLMGSSFLMAQLSTTAALGILLASPCSSPFLLSCVCCHHPHAWPDHSEAFLNGPITFLSLLPKPLSIHPEVIKS